MRIAGMKLLESLPGFNWHNYSPKKSLNYAYQRRRVKMKKTLAFITLLVIIGIAALLYSKTVQQCYTYCKKYDQYSQFVACMDGCLAVFEQQ